MYICWRPEEGKKKGSEVVRETSGTTTEDSQGAHKAA